MAQTSEHTGGHGGASAAAAARTELLYLHDAYLREFDATVATVDGDRVALDRTAFHPTGDGQPYDTGTIGAARVTAVRNEAGVVWHALDGPVPAVGSPVHGVVDWERRHTLIRVVKTESKGKSNKRIRIEVLDSGRA